MELVELYEWLEEQAPVILVMGIGIVWLQRQLMRCQKRNEILTENVIKIATLWETKSQSLSDDDTKFKREIYEKLNEISTILKVK